MWPANYELDNAAYSVYSHPFYSSSSNKSAPVQPNGQPKGSPHQFNGECDELGRGDRSLELNRSADLSKSVELPNRTGELARTSAELGGRYSSGHYPSPCSPKPHLPARMSGLNGSSFWPNYTSYSNYNQIATAIAAVQTAVANSEPGQAQGAGYSSANLIHNAGSDSFRHRPASSLDATSSNSFYNSTTCLSLDLPASASGNFSLSVLRFWSKFCRRILFASLLNKLASKSALFQFQCSRPFLSRWTAGVL